MRGCKSWGINAHGGLSLAYFPEMKVGLPNRQSVCSPLITFELNHEIWYGGNAIQGDLNEIILNPISSIILKLRFKVVR
jgi:hypothetical protein